MAILVEYALEHKYNVPTFSCHTHEIYTNFIEEKEQWQIILYHKGTKMEIDLGYVGPNEDGIRRRTIDSNECICFYDSLNGKREIKYMFYIPTCTFINGEQKELEEMFMLLFGHPFNKELPEKPMVRHITLSKTRQEN